MLRPLLTIAALLLAFLASSGDATGAARQQPAPRPISADDAVNFAVIDVANLPVEVRPYIRYLSLHNLPPAMWAAYSQTLDFTLLSLSRRRTLAFGTPVAGGALLRVNLDDYGLPNQAWDDLAEKGSGPVRVAKKQDQPEPYFQVKTPAGRKVKKRVKVNVPAYYGDDGKTYDWRWEDREEDAPGLAHGPWINPTAVTTLSAALTTNHPVLRADWFLANATITPAYNELLGFKTLRDFQDFVRFRERDEDLATKGIVVDSQEVALHQRAARITPTSLGRYWETYDYFTSVGDDDLLKDLVKKRRDAGEVFADGPNGLQYFLLVDGQDKVLDFADPNVAIDQNTAWKNKLVWGGLISCTSCHVDGAKDIRDEVRLLSRPPIGLLVKDKEKFRQVVDLFSAPIDDPITQTRAAYARAVAAASRGLTPAKNTAALQSAFLAYVQAPLTLTEAAAEVGATPEEAKAILLKAINVDHTLTQLAAGRPIRRDQWEDAGYQQLATLIFQQRRKP